MGNVYCDPGLNNILKEENHILKNKFNEFHCLPYHNELYPDDVMHCDFYHQNIVDSVNGWLWGIKGKINHNTKS